MNKQQTKTPGAMVLACPFCGCKEAEDKHDDGYCWTECKRCRATGPGGTKYSDEDSPSWNTRVAPEQPPAVGGEPVYQTCNGVGGWIDVDLLRYTACQLDPEEYECRVLYRQAQPATAKVVLPERMVLANPAEHEAPVSIHADLTAGWNACLDEVAKLNGGA